ncbi:Golgi-associated plant pathogenesis-related protein 1, partial [Melipona quadrifasciata]
LNQLAQEWADELARRAILRYRSDPEYGENIYRSFWRDVPYRIKPEDPLERWYGEGSYFKYGEDEMKDLDAARHFTQLIWKKTESIGLGLANDDSGKFYLVCIYHPAGNVAGEFVENVFPPTQVRRQLFHSIHHNCHYFKHTHVLCNLQIFLVSRFPTPICRVDFRVLEFSGMERELPRC